MASGLIQQINWKAQSMANVEVLKVKKAAEKLCIDCVVDVARAIQKFQNDLGARVQKMANDIAKLPLPGPGIDLGDLDKLSDEINEILKREGADFNKLVGLRANISLDKAQRKMSVKSTAITGLLPGV
jgi:hypothetical protein